MEGSAPGRWHYVDNIPCPSEGSLHSSDSVSDSSPPPAVVQTGVPTQVVQQVQTAQQVKYARAHRHNMKGGFLDPWHSIVCLSQQRSVVQATSQIAKTEPGTQLSVTSLQPVHISPEVSQTHARKWIIGSSICCLTISWTLTDHHSFLRNKPMLFIIYPWEGIKSGIQSFFTNVEYWSTHIFGWTAHLLDSSCTLAPRWQR